MILGYYEVLSELGSGTFGTVLRVKDIRSGDIAAMKCISKNKIQRNKMGDQVKKEINTMKSLKHPNIIQIKDVLMDKTHLYITMEYVSGGELYQKIAMNGRMSEKNARRYFRQILEAVKYCHELNICHRDIKPENILLDKNDQVKIADFGFASIMEVDGYNKPSLYSKEKEEFEHVSFGSIKLDKFFSDNNKESFVPSIPAKMKRLESKIMMRLSTICGTSLYMAPEIMNRDGYFGDKADIWSCGVVLYYLLMSSLPFDDGDFENMTKDSTTTKYKLSSNLSAEVKDLISKLLEYSPRNRYSARRSLNHAWFDVKDNTPPVIKESTPSMSNATKATKRLSIIEESDDSYVGETSVTFDLDIKSCISRISSSLDTLSWMHKKPDETTTIIKTSKITSGGMALIQLELVADSEDKSTVLNLEIFGDNKTGSKDIQKLMDKIREMVNIN